VLELDIEVRLAQLLFPQPSELSLVKNLFVPVVAKAEEAVNHCGVAFVYVFLNCNRDE
jgi:hypothetical protein